ncbi:helix-turn-helix domain-containing protein [Aliarcobacter butzleri]|uniref:helix-turn-helix domain-containing protein n=1 Tax=Aliarcobacter butzleri TaxID=28197 RepID=UPI0021B4A094|nr:helix-turn-helix domain-containing protein [Aliarcobacter butzleri]MCT7627045.1 helix-turn-helix domain-containing protein [Aliarcobacter butzleri]
MNVNYNSLLPNKILFSLKEIEDLGAIKTDMAKKLIYSGFLEVVKIGNKIHISREELIRYLKENTYPAKNIA